mmetsp:Transcript_68948/g.197765  ORF Transcript_68948/g.197765 Transcript_68948/m.197765 type:complete len:314 (+) Transcript_68948:222-1163(+)
MGVPRRLRREESDVPQPDHQHHRRAPGLACLVRRLPGHAGAARSRGQRPRRPPAGLRRPAVGRPPRRPPAGPRGRGTRPTATGPGGCPGRRTSQSDDDRVAGLGSNRGRGGLGRLRGRERRLRGAEGGRDERGTGGDRRPESARNVELEVSDWFLREEAPLQVPGSAGRAGSVGRAKLRGRLGRQPGAHQQGRGESSRRGSRNAGPEQRWRRRRRWRCGVHEPAAGHHSTGAHRHVASESRPPASCLGGLGVPPAEASGGLGPRRGSESRHRRFVGTLVVLSFGPEVPSLLAAGFRDRGRQPGGGTLLQGARG